MGNLKNQIFLQFANKGIDEVREEFIQKFTPKKGNRFFIKGITYEIGPCGIESGNFVCEISSKIPQDLLPERVSTEKYFNKVAKIVNKSKKKPTDPKMENIIRNTKDLEIKERDYVKLTYCYEENELYTLSEVEKRLNDYKARKIPIPNIPGVATPSGKFIIAIIKESMAKLIKQNVTDLINANETVKKIMSAKKKKSSSKPKSAAQTKPSAGKKKNARVAKKKTAAKKKK